MGRGSTRHHLILFPPDDTELLERDAPPAQIRAALVPAVPMIVDAVIAAIRGEERRTGHPESALERNLRVGLTHAVERWFAAASPSVDTDLHFALGRAHARSGRGLDELMGFYRVAGRTAWLRASEVGAAQGIQPEHLYRLAATGFCYVDQLSTQAAAGYAEEQSHRSGAKQSRRTELLRLLLRSLEQATTLLTLMRRGLVESSPLVRAEDHDLALLLSAHPQLASELIGRRLAPLEAIHGAKSRRNLTLTLRAWLRNPGQRKAIADSLAVHPQTVRYRMARLRELFGDALDNPDGRFELELALRLARYATPGEADG